MLRRAVVFALVVLALGAAAAAAQDSLIPVAPPTPTLTNAYGGGIQQRLIPVSEFVPDVSGYAYASTYGKDLQPTAPGEQLWIAPLGLPSGAAIDEIRVLIRDEDAAEDIEAVLTFVARAIDGSDACDGSFGYGHWDETSAGINGLGTVVLQDDEPLLVETQSTTPCGVESYRWLSLAVWLRSMNHAFSGAVVRWHLTVSPRPLTATFNDVPTNHPFFQFVEALAASGITAGCGSGNFCPDSSLTRGQMAVFLAKALGLHWPL